jgi:pilus assembly protein CpaF
VLPLAAIRAQIGSALNFIIHLSRDRQGVRRVISITEVGEYDRSRDQIGLTPIFVFDEKEGRLEKVGEPVFAGDKKGMVEGEPV